jgi:hypothetical protein
MYLAQQPFSKSHAALLISKQILDKSPPPMVQTHRISPSSVGAHATLMAACAGAQGATQEHVEPSLGPQVILQSSEGVPDPVVVALVVAPFVPPVVIVPLVVAAVGSPVPPPAPARFGSPSTTTIPPQAVSAIAVNAPNRRCLMIKVSGGTTARPSGNRRGGKISP